MKPQKFDIEIITSQTKSPKALINNNIFQKIKHSPNEYSNRHLPSRRSLETKIYSTFIKTYSNNADFYNIKIINEIINNETSHIVAEFKDYLINGDYSEFIQNYFILNESIECLPKIFEYYENSSVIFPNYVILPESKYIYKNIQRKQRIIDNQQELEVESDKKEGCRNSMTSEDLVFDTQAVDSILNQSNSSTTRALFGLLQIAKDNEFSKEEKDKSSKDSSPNKILNKIEQAENWVKANNDKITVNCTLKIQKKKQSRNHYRNPSHQLKTNNTNNILLPYQSSMNSLGKENKTYHLIINSNKSKKCLLNNLYSTNKDIVAKAVKEMNKMKNINPSNRSRNNKPNIKIGKTMQTNKSPSNGLLSKGRKNKMFPSSSNGTFTIISSKNNNYIIKTKESISKGKFKHDKRKSNGAEIFFKKNMPLTSREAQKLSINPEIMQMINSKINKVKNFNKISSVSLSHKKTFTSSSAATATGSYNANNKLIEDKNYTNINNSNILNGTSITQKNKKYISVTQRSSSHKGCKDNLTKSSNGMNSVKSFSSVTSKNPKRDSIFYNNNSISISKQKIEIGNRKMSPENMKFTKIKTCHHTLSPSNVFPPNSNAIKRNINNKVNKKLNVVIPIRNDCNIKGIEIKGFNELLHCKSGNSRNNNCSSERMTFESLTNAPVMTNKSNRNITLSIYDLGKYDFHDVFRTKMKKK